MLESPIVDAEYRRAFAALQKENVTALLVNESAENFGNRQLIVELANTSRLPTVYPYRDYASIGGLVAYATDIKELMRQAATQIEKILNGAKPSDVPYYQATKFELVINLRTAKALGITIQPTLLARADEVIESTRREFIALLGGGALALVGLSLVARAQQAIRRIGVLRSLPADDPETKVRLAAFVEGLQKMGWSEGHNVHIEYRLGAARAISTERANTWQNCWRSRRTSSLLQVAQTSSHCYRRPALCQSCSQMSPTRSAQASSTA